MSQSEKAHSLSPVMKGLFANKEPIARYPFLITGINKYAELLENMKSYSKHFPYGVSIEESTIAFALVSSVLDKSCLLLLVNQRFGSLTELTLLQCHIGDEGVEFLAKNLPHSLTTVTIKESNVTYVGVSYLFKSALSYIHVSCCSPSPASGDSTQCNTLPPLSRDVTLPMGSRFIFKDMLMPGGEFKEYFLSGNVDSNGIVELDLEGSYINESDLHTLSKKGVENLSKLNLAKGKLDDRYARVLKDCRFPDSMELNLGYNSIDNMGLQYLLEAPFFEKLSVLRMNNNTFNHKGWEISRVLTFKTLQYLNLSDNNIGPDGASLIASHHYPQLGKLYLSNALLGDQGAQYLTRNSFPSLVLASLNSNNIGSQGAISLASAGWQKLDSLILEGNPVGCKGVLAFVSRNLRSL